jgi:hemerythrin superfamily protein
MRRSTSTSYVEASRTGPNTPSQLLNEIMPMIYKRFTEKASEEWRQIYKVWQSSHSFASH